VVVGTGKAHSRGLTPVEYYRSVPRRIRGLSVRNSLEFSTLVPEEALRDEAIRLFWRLD
jgi:hypothetical protein